MNKCLHNRKSFVHLTQQTNKQIKHYENIKLYSSIFISSIFNYFSISTNFWKYERINKQTNKTTIKI